jgi:hypothetical protein
MFRLINLRLLRFFALSVFLLGAQAFAQFEVSPDHFDSPAQQQAKHRRAKANTQSHAGPATAGNSAKSAAVQHKKTLHKNKATASASQPVTRETTTAKLR